MQTAHWLPRDISESEARAQAEAYAGLRTSSADGGGLWRYDEMRGVPIDWESLKACGRTYYVESAYDTVPRSAANWIQIGLGAYWLVRLCESSGEAPIVLAVSARSDARIVKGRIRSPAFNSGNNFKILVVPKGTGPVPMDPEAAIAFASRVTGARVIRAPVLVSRTNGDGAVLVAPQCGLWQLALDRPVRGVGDTTHSSYETSVVRVGQRGCTRGDTSLYVALRSQPDTARTTIYDFHGPDGPGRRDTVRVAMLNPHRFEVFHPTR